MTFGRSFANYLIDRLPLQRGEDDRTNDERQQQRGDGRADCSERDVIENVENPELSRERKQEVVEHNDPGSKETAGLRRLTIIGPCGDRSHETLEAHSTRAFEENNGVG